MDETRTLTLRKPVEFGGETFAALELREPTAGEFAKASSGNKSNAETTLALIAAVAKVPMKVVEGMGLRDFQEAASYLAGFTEDGPATGESSSPT